MVSVRKRKWPNEAHLEWTARDLGRDEYGTWLFSAAGERHHRVTGGSVVLPNDGVLLLPPASWWVCWWWRTGLVAVDISTPPVHTDDGWSYVDLELDVVRTPDGQVLVVDEDEFAELAARPDVAPETVSAARTAATTVAEMLREKTEPFATAGQTWLDRR